MDRKNKTETHQLSGTPSSKESARQMEVYKQPNHSHLEQQQNDVRMYQMPSESESRTYFRMTQHTSRPGIIKTEPPHSELHFLKTRPEGLSYRCFSSSLEGLEYLGKPIIGSPTQSIMQVDMIARWIKEILKEASSNLKTKDARLLAAFYTQNS
ncbi:7175_t:CDS:2, partial [Cetraspora pellucida]